MKLMLMHVVERVPGRLKVNSHDSTKFLFDVDENQVGYEFLSSLIGEVFDSRNTETGETHRVIAVAVMDFTVVVERYTSEHADAALRLLDES